MLLQKILILKIRFPRHLKWYGHVRRPNEDILPHKILEWCPPGRRRKGRPRNLLMQQVTIGRREKGINNMEWIDREEWRRKAQQDVVYK